VDDELWALEQFEHHRKRLRAVAYRMLGSLTEADDALQETWLRLSRSSAGDLTNVGGWLTTVVGRVCLDMLRSRRARREDYLGAWLPEAVVGTDPTGAPEQESVLVDSVGLALLVVLEHLSPGERLAFVLHDMFGVPFDDIGPMLDRTPEAARQLASRARRRVRGVATPDPDLGRQREAVDAFLAAARAGDFDRLVALLHPEVVFRVDGGGRVRRGPALLTGAAAVAEQAAAQGPRFARLCRPALVNGAAGLLVTGARGPIGAAGMTVVDGLIVEIDLVLDPDKLRSFEAAPANDGGER
jgi:RNA polymerase sigma-70 factor (ECF subfamily)